MAIKQKTIDAVKALPISEVLSAEGIALKKIGREFLSKCPWHNDTNPSLTINDDKGLCFCFVCKGGSDAVSFLQQHFSLSFAETIQRIADKHNIVYEEDGKDAEYYKQLKAKRNIQIQKLEAVQEVFRGNLKNSAMEPIRQLLKARGITPETSREFGLGYCAEGFFASRITIPIYNYLGELVAFTARATQPDQNPKYKNSNASDIFDKSKIVFNEHKATEAIREADSIIFVEGQFDVISMHQTGIRNVVATQGTAAPDINVIKRLARRSKRFILCYDADAGGHKAIEQFLSVAGPMACKGELTISVATLPPGHDPDQCIRDESIDLYSIINNAPSWLDWQLDVWLSKVDRSDTHKFSAIERAIRELIESIHSPALRQFYIDKASKALLQDKSAAATLAKQWAGSVARIHTKRKWTRPTPAETRTTAEKRLVRLYLHAPEFREYCKPLIEKIQSPLYRWIMQRITEIESECGACDACRMMSILLVAEPHYARQLRPIIMPTINVDKSPGVLRHIEDTLCKELIMAQEDDDA